MQSIAFWGILWRNLCICDIQQEGGKKTKQNNNNNKKNKAGVQRVAESWLWLPYWRITRSMLAKKTHRIPPLFCSQRGNKDLESRAVELVKLQEQRRWRRQRSSAARRKDEAVPGMSLAPAGQPSATQQNKIPIIVKLEIAWDNGTATDKEQESWEWERKQPHRSPSQQALITHHHSGEEARI